MTNRICLIYHMYLNVPGYVYIHLKPNLYILVHAFSIVLGPFPVTRFHLGVLRFRSESD